MLDDPLLYTVYDPSDCVAAPNERPFDMAHSTASDSKPNIALAIGDPAGISPELTARLVADAEIRAAARLFVIGDARVLARGAEVAKVNLDIAVIARDAVLPLDAEKPVLVDVQNCDPATIRIGEAQRAGGLAALENYKTALSFAVAGVADAVTFTPFNKAAMRLGYPAYEDEIGFTATMIGFHGKASEFNILDKLWNARVTSHVPLSAVASLITEDAILEGLTLTDRALRAAGFEPARIAVAALNPHAGDGGNFGREDMDVIAPAVEKAKAQGIVCDGPFPSDTVFVRARKGQFDAVLTMYHDQGQIAMKLLGFESGVTLLGGFPFPIATPAHGTAYDIAGQGIANPGASRAAILLAAKMGRQALARRGASSARKAASSADMWRLLAA